jgi:subtilisin-like proprotein convertase family protein
VSVPVDRTRRPARFLGLALAVALAAAPLAAQTYQIVPLAPDHAVKGQSDAKPGTPPGRPGAGLRLPSAPAVPLGQGYLFESEPNDTAATASPLGGSNVVARGGIFPNGDLDYWSFNATAGDVVYAAVMTSDSSNGSSDSQMDLLDVDGVTSLEFDDDDGSLGGLSSSIAGHVLPASGTYYLRVKHFSATGQLRPYELHFRLQSGAPTAEVEPNDSPGTANPLPGNGWVSGTRDPALATEQDWYSFSANAGDTVFLSLDLDPERDGVTWNGRLGIALFGDVGNQILVVDDGNAGVAGNPPSEATFMTIKSAGTYYAFVDSASAATGGPTATYTLSVSILPHVDEGLNCTVYFSTDVPQTIGPGAGLVTSTILVPGHPRIADVDLEVQLTHALMADIDAHLRSPQGNDLGVFTDIGSGATGGQTLMDLWFDDEAGIPPAYTVVKGLVLKPELSYRLSWFDGEDAGGLWMLDLRDDTTNASGGTLNAWSLRICEAPPPPACGPGMQPVTVYSSDFEADDGGFTHSGALDDWALGLPASPPLASCNSGTSCWKTNLAGTYSASSVSDLFSPQIDLTGLSGPVVVTWAQQYQMESASFDHWNVTAREAGNPSNAALLYQWDGATMTDTVGNPTTTIQEAAGWGLYQRRIDFLAGTSAELLFHLDSDSSINFAGAAVDDVTVTACEPAPIPGITVVKTVGTSPGTCAQTNDIIVPLGTPVTYCYTATNTGGVPLDTHTVVDDHLGVLLSSANIPLAPGDSFFFTVDDVVLDATTTNTVTWTASGGTASSTVCSTPALSIPDNDPTGVTDTLIVPSGDSLIDLDVSIGAAHTWVGDLAFQLSNGAVSATVYDRPGVPASTFGCSGDNVAVEIDDDGPDTPVENQCANLPAIAGDAPGGDPPSTSLMAAFNGQPLAGTWTLHAADFVGGDVGTLDQWCLIATTAGSQVSDTDSATVTVQFPDILVDPASLFSFQPVEVQIDQEMAVMNLGPADLDWTITEDGGPSAERVGRPTRLLRVPGRQEPLRAHHASPGFPAGSGHRKAAVGDAAFSRSGSGSGRTVAPLRPQVPDSTVTITESATQNIVQGNSVACNNGIGHADNHYIRAFDLDGFGLSQGLTVTQVEVGIESATGAGGTQPVEVRLYVWNPSDPFTFANFVSIGTASAQVPDQSLTIITVPVSGTAPAHSNLVVDFFTPNGEAVGDLLFVGSNPDGQTAPTFLAAADCGVPDPLDTATIGFPGMMMVMNVTGTTGCNADLPWVSESSTSGTTAPFATTPVTVTFDSTGLTPGGIYVGSLCISSNDPDTPLVLVPLLLEVDSLPFNDGFETGDTNRWSIVQP